MPRGIELDWVVVHVNTLKRGLAIVATGVLAAAMVFLAHNRLNLSPEARARKAIERASVAHEEAAAKPLPPQWRGELSQAKSQLDSARTAYAEEQWENAEGLAENARSRFEALAGAGDREVVGAGQFFSLEGRVQIQRAGKTEWESAHQRMPVFNGDFVRTARDGSAEVLFADGSLYRIAPNSLLEIHHQQSEESSGAVKMVVGRINVFTSGSSSTVTTETTSTEIEQDSRVAVGVDEGDQETTVAAFRGSAKVRNPRGVEVVVAERQQVAADAAGSFSDKRPIPAAPVAVEPQNNAAFNIARRPQIRLVWQGRPTDGVVHLQVSRSKRFLAADLDVDALELAKDDALLEAIHPGTFFWRVAAVDGLGVSSEWSQVRRFRIFSSAGGRILEDNTPPALEIDPPHQLGHMFIIEGTAEVGATVTVNGEAVELDNDGRFRKTIEVTQEGWTDLVVVAVDPAGNRSERREHVYVEVF